MVHDRLQAYRRLRYYNRKERRSQNGKKYKIIRREPRRVPEGRPQQKKHYDRALDHARKQHLDVVIVDTAGRLAIDEAMMAGIAELERVIEPAETLFVVDAMTGQDAVNTAKAFNEVLDYDGVVLTKLDGDTRGGAAISIKSVVHKPIKFIGTGEKMEAIDVFHPDRMADRILGMGDVVSLDERAQE